MCEIDAVLCSGARVVSVTDLSDKGTDRMRVKFTNGYQLSIIRGEFSYGWDRGLFEIAPFNKEGALDGSLFDEEDQGDDVCGCCDEEKVEYYLRKISSLR